MFTNPNQPNLTDFTTFVYNQGVPQLDLPSDSSYLVWAFNYALNTALYPAPALPGIVYTMAVYNLGMHKLLKVAQDSLIVSSVTITNAGSGYLSAPEVTFSAAPSGWVTATGIAVLNAETVSSVTITNSGSYPPGSMPTVSFAAPESGTTATGTVITTPQTFFSSARTQFNLLTFIAGPVTSSGDQGTNETLLPAEWMKDMTLLANDLLKTPWGRDYLEYAQDYGPTIVGVS